MASDLPLPRRVLLRARSNALVAVQRVAELNAGRKMAARMRRPSCHADSALAADADLCALAAELDRTHPGAAASLREGLPETLTVLGLNVPHQRESMISLCRTNADNVKH